MFKGFLGYLGDYSSPVIDFNAYRRDLLLAGAESGSPIYDKCMEIIESEFPGKRQLKILDLACGGGAFGKACHAKGKDYIIDGIDLFVPEKQALLETGIYNKIIEANILGVNFEDEYDLVVSNQFFEHLLPAEALGLLKQVSLRFKNILISVPLAYHTFAYTQSYLQGSLRESEEISEEVLGLVLAATHKCYFPQGLMKLFGFVLKTPPVYYSNYFFKSKVLAEAPSVRPEVFFKFVPDAQVDKRLGELYKKYKVALPRPKNRMEIEKNFVRALLMEPFRYKFMRFIIYCFTHPFRALKNKLKK